MAQGPENGAGVPTRGGAAPPPSCFVFRLALSMVYRRDCEIIALGLGPISQVSANDFATSCHIAACCARQVCARRILPTLCVRAYLNYLCILHTFHPNCFQTYYFLDGFPSKTLPATFLSFAARREREKAEWQMYELANESTLSLTSAMEMKIR